MPDAKKIAGWCCNNSFGGFPRGVGCARLSRSKCTIATNLTTPLSNWTKLLTNQFDPNGNVSVTNSLDPNATRNFYLQQTL